MGLSFDDAAAKVKTFKKDPGSSAKLELYGWFKQVKDGDCTGDRPGMFSMEARAKYDAWNACKGMSADDCKAKYIAKVEELAKTCG
mmetsp:Transcript_2082/g.4844  ORF Transcript_2082/g.4844 Transcript_2082/m.4844 type:complete len:86 (-) Transcript_2082:342-599(-)|eukprot:CAMPEP_0178982730 /NCGR_PEP_ID=MMETSP0795-20121207/664_1 /TAXON_ID=88552 /ORGANISM="Amoebophrya sp., Strain Ameob2" /LENGTH=85 /DNA_ID=CAMNT_0020673419 /DNA_START=120 /DNA_END=377 /DNA_ORIENTATION=+